jgi:hypothetical protein
MGSNEDCVPGVDHKNMTNDSNLRELETWYQRAGKLRDPGYWESLRTGDKSCGT